MSVVTNVVVHVEYAPTETLTDLFKELPFDIRKQALAKVPYAECGGTKAMETELYTGAFNYLDTEQFLKWFASLAWDEVSDATVSIYEQDGEARILRVEGGSVGEWFQDGR